MSRQRRGGRIEIGVVEQTAERREDKDKGG